MRRFEHDGEQYVYLDTKEQADELVSDELIEEVLGWFHDRKGVPANAFIDKLCDTYGRPYGDKKLGFDIDNYDNAASRSILSRARRIKKEQES